MHYVPPHLSHIDYKKHGLTYLIFKTDEKELKLFWFYTSPIYVNNKKYRYLDIK